MLDHGVPSVSLSYYTAEHSISNWGKTIFKKRYRINLLKTVKELDSIKAEWEKLFRRKSSYSHFQSFSWLYLYVSYCYKNNPSLSIYLLYRDDQLIAIAPFAEKRAGIIWKYHFVVEKTQADYLDIIYGDIEDYELEYLLVTILERHKFASIRLKKLPEKSKTVEIIEKSKTLKVLEAGKDRCVQIILGNSVEAYTNKLGKSTKKEIKTVENKIRRNFSSVEIKILYDKKICFDMLRLMMDMYRQRRKEKLKKERRTEEYFQFISRYIQESENLFVSMLKMDGNMVAFNIGFLSANNSVEIMITAFDSRYVRYQVGNYLLYHSIKEIIEGGSKEARIINKYDLGQGDELYKIKYGGEIQHVKEIHIFKKGAYYNTIRVALAIKRLIRRGLRIIRAG